MDVLRESLTFPSAVPGVNIHAEIFRPDGEIKAILQFAHGMSDYGRRYTHLFQYLAAKGYLTAYNDHLGHGETASTEADLGYFAPRDGYKKVIADFENFYNILTERWPGLPHFVMGHSMGSFIVRCFLASGKSDGAVIMGTANKNPLADFGIILAGLLKKLQGERHRSVLLARMSFGGYNKRISDSDHDWAWLSTEPQAQKAILADNLRNKLFTTSAFQDLFYLLKYANDDKVIAKIPLSLPMLFISGSDDPLGPYGEGINKLCAALRKKGFSAVTTEIIPGARHELCHESEAIQRKVFNHIIVWLDEQVKILEETNKDV